MTGNELKKIRDEEFDISQEHLARVLDISVSTIARWEQLKDKEIPNGKLLFWALEGVKAEMKRHKK